MLKSSENKYNIAAVPTSVRSCDISYESESSAHIQPRQLQALCIDVICYNYPLLCKKVICECPASGDGDIDDFVGYELRLGNFRLPVSLSEDLLNAMTRYHLLTDHNLQMFNSKHANLHRVMLNHMPITLRGLQILHGHALYELRLTHIETKLEQCLGEEVIGEATKSSLKVLKICQCRVTAMSDECLTMDTMSRIALNFTNLVSLSLVSIELQNDGLSRLCYNLTSTVASLDISDNPITDISPLCVMADNLKSLIMYNLISLRETNFEVLSTELKELQHLDISCETGHQLEAFLNEEVSPLPVERLLTTRGAMATIISLDISGREIASAKHVRMFIQSHPNIQFLGLIMTPAGHSDEFFEKDHQDYIQTLKISSLATEDLIVESLRRYHTRHFYVQKALVSLFQSTRYTTDARHGIIQVVIDVMMEHLDYAGVQMAATACLYNLTRDDVGQKIHTECLRLMVCNLLECMTKHPSNEQLQKNCLLTLCSDRILMEVNFDRYRCTQLVMECLCKFEDDAISRMSLAVISILAAKISTDDTSILASNPQYMVRLIEITRNKMKSLTTDRTMRFALSALWNLTDESPKACHCFFKLHGLELAIECLKEYNKITDNEARLQIQTKVVGLLNNIAEVDDLKEHLITDNFINLMRESLRNSFPEYSYFSAGILANLLCDVHNPAWRDLHPLFNHVQDEMITIITNWGFPENAMVAYRCFKPFQKLLKVEAPAAVQCWALWAINHVCVKDAERYIPMLMRDGIYTDIVRLAEMKSTYKSEKVWRMSNSLHLFISHHHVHREHPAT